MGDLMIYSLNCPGCGAALKVREALDTFACSYCGASVQVDRGEGVVSLRLLTDALQSVQRGTDRTAAELAIRRISEEIRGMERDMENLRSTNLTVAAEWAQAMKPRDQRGSIFAIVITGIVVWTVVQWLLGPFDQLSAEVKEVAGFVVACAAAVFVWRTIMRGQERELARQMVTRDQELSSIAAKAADLELRIAAASDKLKEHRKVVDS